ncbi:MAG: DMT family transporter [Alphaproteobacteria bacterium]|nr:DMT family transporter [Alphaproteobacteria bacterium]
MSISEQGIRFDLTPERVGVRIAMSWPTAPFGMGLAVLAAIGFGLLPLFARWAYAGGVAADGALLWRYVIGGGAFLLFWPAALRRPRAALIGVLVGVLMGFGMQGYFRALQELPIALPALIYFSYPAITLLLGWLFFAGKPNARGVSAVALVLGGAVLIIGVTAIPDGAASSLWLCVLAPLSFALLIHALAGDLRHLPLMARGAPIITGILAVLVPASALGGELTAGALLPDTALGWAGVFGLVVATSLIPQLLYGLAVPLAGAERVSIAGSLEMVVTLAVGWLAFAEPMGYGAALGACLVLGGFFLSIGGRPGRKRL